MTSAALKTVLALTCALALFAGGYHAGWTRADAARQAEVATLEAGHAQAVAEAERQARERLQAETARAGALAAQLGDAKARLVTQTRDITRRIRNAAKAASGCTFGPEFVGLYNEALG